MSPTGRQRYQLPPPVADVGAERRWPPALPFPPLTGIDFSGAKVARRRIWVATAAVEGGSVRIEACFRAKCLPGSSSGRDHCLTALLEFVAGQKAAVLGFDFPFGLPRKLVKQQTWEAFAVDFPEMYASPTEFRLACREEAGPPELKRYTDRESQTPFSPYNLRLFRQTFYGIRELLHPLVRDGMACVLPMQGMGEGRPWILEVCPASTLKRERLYVPY